MLRIVRLGVLVTFSFLAACDARTALDVNQVQGSNTSGKTAGAGAPGGGPVNGATDETMTADAGVTTIAPGQPAPTLTPDASAAVDAPLELLSCAALASGGAPDRLLDFEWQYRAAAGQSSAAYDFVSIDPTCTMSYQHENAKRSLTMSANDCDAARGWTTNQRFLQVLRTGDGCPYGTGNPDDAFDLDLKDEGRVARKTYLCPEPTVEAVRACLRPLIARLFPN